MTARADRLSGRVHALYLFDVAQAIDLGTLRQRLGARARTARLDDKTAGPAVRYQIAPVVADGAAFDAPPVDGFTWRAKFFDYGVISLMLTQDFSGDWDALVALGQKLIESESVEQLAADLCARVLEQTRGALTGARTSLLSEDYLVFAVTEHDGKPSADALVAAHGADIAQLVRGERQPLAAQEREEVLRHRFSYLCDDLVVPAWNAAFVYDQPASVLATVEVLEFANSHLLEFRYHDDLLDAELTRIYAELQAPRWSDRLSGWRHARAARRVQSLVIDVNELTDRMENAVKFVGDIYSARLFGNVGARLGLDRWKRNVEEKLKTLDDIHQFAVGQIGMSQANLLEFGILLICAIELWVLVAGLAK